MSRFSRIFLLSLFVAIPYLSRAQSDYTFNRIRHESGLSPYVQSVMVDSRDGYVWFCTRTGIGRYDGYESKKYLSEEAAEIFEDGKGNIWVLSLSGCFRYSAEVDEFLPVPDEGNSQVRAISYTLVDDGVLIGGVGSIYKYNYTSDKISKLCNIAGDDSYEVKEILEWDRGHVIVGGRGQETLLVDLATGHGFRSVVRDDDLNSLLRDRDGNIWLSPYNGGLKCYDKNGKLLQSFNKSNSTLGTNIVLDMEECEGEIWVGTDGDGIYVINPRIGIIAHECHTPGDPSSMPAKSITKIFAHSSEEFWMGTVRNGLVRVKKSPFHTYGEAALGTSYGLTNSAILSMLEDSDGKIWIGTDGGGVNRLDPITDKFTHFPSSMGDKITSIADATPGSLMVSKYGEGFYLMDKASGTFTPKILVDEQTDARLCRSGSSIAIFKDTPGTILILTREPFSYDISTGTFTPITAHDKSKLEGFASVVGQDENNVYIADEEKILSIRRGETSMRVIFRSPDKKVLDAVVRDPRGFFLVGGSFGLGTVEDGDDDITPIPCEFFNEVSAIADAGNGLFWIGADEKLFSYRAASGEFTLYSEADGVNYNEYHPRAHLITESGDVFVGGNNGLVRIKPNQRSRASGLSGMILEELRIAGAKVIPDGNDPIRIDQRKMPIEIEVFARSNDLVLQPMYKYTVQGPKMNDVSHSMSPWVTLSGLSSGKYTLKAACSTRYGGWSEDYEIISFRIHPPWFRSWWFFLLCGLCLGAFILLLYKMAKKRDDEKVRRLMEEHDMRAEQEKVDFLINIDHELRTPLTLIEAPVKQVQKTLSKDDERYALLENVSRQSAKMKNLLDMVLDVGRIEQIRDVVSREKVDINEWLGQIIEDFSPEAQKRGVTLTAEAFYAPDAILMDKKKSTSVITNLVMNALKYSPEKSHITISAMTQGGDMIRFSVADQGVGLKNVDMERLFTRFYQGKKSKPGTGIGLAYAKLLVEQQGGRIGAFDNAPKEGSTFWFELPKDPVQETVTQEMAISRQEEESSSSTEIKKEDVVVSEDKMQKSLENISVLIIDDNEDLVHYLADNLWPYCDKIFTAGNGLDGLKLCRSHKPDIVISDVQMPGMDGFELCRTIKRDMEISHIPVVILTSMTDEDSKQFGYKNGADAYISKPFDMDTLKYVMCGILDNRKRAVEKFSQGESMPSPVESTFSSADEEFLFTLDKIIEKNLDNTELSVALLCKEIGMSRAALYNKIKALTDMGANDYITKTRISAAALMLRTMDLKMSEVADKTGFSTQRYFSTVFKQYMGCTPSEYKSKVGGTPEN